MKFKIVKSDLPWVYLKQYDISKYSHLTHDKIVDIFIVIMHPDKIFPNIRMDLKNGKKTFYAKIGFWMMND